MSRKQEYGCWIASVSSTQGETGWRAGFYTEDEKNWRVPIIETLKKLRTVIETFIFFQNDHKENI